MSDFVLCRSLSLSLSHTETLDNFSRKRVEFYFRCANCTWTVALVVVIVPVPKLDPLWLPFSASLSTRTIRSVTSRPDKATNSFFLPPFLHE